MMKCVGQFERRTLFVEWWSSAGWEGGTTTFHCTHYALAHRLKVLSLFLVCVFLSPALKVLSFVERFVTWLLRSVSFLLNFGLATPLKICENFCGLYWCTDQDLSEYSDLEGSTYLPIVRRPQRWTAPARLMLQGRMMRVAVATTLSCNYAIISCFQHVSVVHSVQGRFASTVWYGARSLRVLQSFW